MEDCLYKATLEGTWTSVVTLTSGATSCHGGHVCDMYRVCPHRWAWPDGPVL